MCIIFNQCFIVCVNFFLSFFFCNAIECRERKKKVDSKVINCVSWKVLLLSKKAPSFAHSFFLATLHLSSRNCFLLLLSISSLRWYIKNRLPWHDMCVCVCVCANHDSWKWKLTIFALSMIYLPFTFPLLLLWRFSSLYVASPLEHIIFTM